MLKLTSVAVLLLCVTIACAEPKQATQQQQQQKQLRSGAAIASPNHPYIFLSVPRANGNGHEVQGFKVVEVDDDENEEGAQASNASSESDDDSVDDDAANASKEDDDDDDDEEDLEHDDDVEDSNDAEFEYNDDDEESVSDENDVASNFVYMNSHAPHAPRLRSQLKNRKLVSRIPNRPQRSNQLNAQLVLKNAKPTNMMVSREHAGAIMVPDGFIEIEGQTVVDEKTGKTALLVPRAALDAIPDGSVVALMEQSVDDSEEARANRVIVHRRRNDARRNLVRRRGGNNRRRRGSNRRRRGGNRRKNVRVYQVGGATRRRGNRRSRRPVQVVQG
ncbi:nucleoplasmin-like protein ANO39 [Anastrepha obliqua]|uniref:nucleoplasmin-like protein ANO39 n=1 Tax=Anastrepha obliqua TaxID=95512 RepID=UPI002409843D|nr:nucleoplasmin-like protein ANO39 [Anastrepha obliqua]